MTISARRRPERARAWSDCEGKLTALVDHRAAFRSSSQRTRAGEGQAVAWRLDQGWSGKAYCSSADRNRTAPPVSDALGRATSPRIRTRIESKIDLNHGPHEIASH